MHHSANDDATHQPTDSFLAQSRTYHLLAVYYRLFV